MTDITVERVCMAIGRFEQNAVPGYGRRLEQAWLTLYPDCTGYLFVEVSSAQNETKEQQVFSAIFPTTLRFRFDSLGELMAHLSNPFLLASTHPELEGAHGEATAG